MSGRRQIRVSGRPELAHSADAVQAGGCLFVAGVLPVDGAGELVGGEDTVAQAEFVFGELGRILAAAGCAFADVVKVSVFLTDVERPAATSTRYGSACSVPARPASTLVEVSGLAVPGARIEVDAVAVIPS